MDLQKRIQELEQLCAEMLQVAGALGAPVRVLDQLHAAADGQHLPHDTVLPFDASECTPLPSFAGSALARHNRGVTSAKKAIASRKNGLQGGRPRKATDGRV